MQKKQDVQLFFFSFSLTLLIFGFLIAFLVVDADSAYRQRGAPAAALSSRPVDPLRYELTVLGNTYTVSLQTYDEAQAIRQSYACLLTPRVIRTAELIWESGRYGVEQLYQEFLDRLFLSEVEASETPTTTS